MALPSFGATEIEEALDALLSGWLTMGERVFEFERRWAQYIGTSDAIAVNSGSSALLVMLSAMIECGHLRRGQEVIVPAVGWSTSLFSVAQAGLCPVLMDVDPETLSLSGEYQDPVLAIHMLGNPAQVLLRAVGRLLWCTWCRNQWKTNRIHWTLRSIFILFQSPHHNWRRWCDHDE